MFYSLTHKHRFEHLLESLKKHQDMLTIQLPIEISDAVLVKLNNKNFNADKNFDAYVFIFRLVDLNFSNLFFKLI